jgi:hypothetical protein
MLVSVIWIYIDIDDNDYVKGMTFLDHLYKYQLFQDSDTLE